MMKNILCLSGACLLSACVSGGGYPAAQTASATGANNAALVGQVLGALTTPQTQNPYPAATTQNNANMLGTVIGALGGQTQNPYPATTTQNNANMLGTVIGALGGQTQAPVQNYGQNYGQNNNTLANVLGAVGGQGNLNGVVQGVLVNQCGAYIRNQPMWQTARMALGNQAQYWEGQVCQCATQEAMNNMTAEQLTQLGMSATSGQAAMSQATANLLSQTAMNCLQRIVGQGGMMR